MHAVLVFVYVQLSRAALQRYLFYCNRYMNHMQSLKFENKVSSSIYALCNLRRQ